MILYQLKRTCDRLKQLKINNGRDFTNIPVMMRLYFIIFETLYFIVRYIFIRISLRRFPFLPELTAKTETSEYSREYNKTSEIEYYP